LQPSQPFRIEPLAGMLRCMSWGKRERGHCSGVESRDMNDVLTCKCQAKAGVHEPSISCLRQLSLRDQHHYTISLCFWKTSESIL
jgi:hypothetical protein